MANASAQLNSPNHPQGLDSAKLATLLMLNPPAFSLKIFGFQTWKQFVDAMDFGKKGYITRCDGGQFWGEH